MIHEIKIGDRIWHNKYGQTKCVSFLENKHKQLVALGENGTFAPVDQWIKLAEPMLKREDEEDAKEIHLD